MVFILIFDKTNTQNNKWTETPKLKQNKNNYYNILLLIIMSQ